MARAIDSEVAYQFLTDQLVKETYGPDFITKEGGDGR